MYDSSVFSYVNATVSPLKCGPHKVVAVMYLLVWPLEGCYFKCKCILASQMPFPLAAVSKSKCQNAFLYFYVET